MKRLFVIVAISLLTFFVISTLVPDVTYARPGGGESYSSDSGSSGGDYGGSSDGGGGTYGGRPIDMIVIGFVCARLG